MPCPSFSRTDGNTISMALAFACVAENREWYYCLRKHWFILFVLFCRENDYRKWNNGCTDDILELGRRETWSSSGFDTWFPVSSYTYQCQ
jgi:hypothetical protein